ncbi:hypothetical protein BC835DRAFT_1225188, partial [Cytidiella melzeri]
IREDISKTYIPSWMSHPLRNFGSPSHGKLKADEWCTICTVHLVITLGRLWGSLNATKRQKQMLKNFFHLVSAVQLGSRKSMSKDRAKAFDGHMFDYLRTLGTSFEHITIRSDHMIGTGHPTSL